MASYVFDPPSWHYNAKSYQQIIIDGVFVPGICMLQEVKLSNIIKDNKKKGASGSQPIIEGFGRVKFDFKSILVTGAQELQMGTFVSRYYTGLDPKQTNSLTIYHPMLAEIGVTNILFEDMKQHIAQPGGVKEYTFTCVSVDKPVEGVSKKATPKKLVPQANLSNTPTIDIKTQQLPAAGKPSEQLLQNLNKKK